MALPSNEVDVSEVNPRRALFLLRISLARIAQAAGLELTGLPILGASYQELAHLARHQHRHWNTLAGMVAGHIAPPVLVRSEREIEPTLRRSIGGDIEPGLR